MKKMMISLILLLAVCFTLKADVISQTQATGFTAKIKYFYAWQDTNWLVVVLQPDSIQVHGETDENAVALCSKTKEKGWLKFNVMDTQNYKTIMAILLGAKLTDRDVYFCMDLDQTSGSINDVIYVHGPY